MEFTLRADYRVVGPTWFSTVQNNDVPTQNVFLFLNFGFDVPVAVPGVDSSILNPRDTWADKDGYDAQAAKLVAMFVANFDKFIEHVDDNVKAAALAAE